MVTTQQSAERDIPMTPAPSPTNGSAGHVPRSTPAEPSDCVGPLPVPPELTRAVRALAEDAGVDDFAALAICAGVLVRRLSYAATPRRARVIRGGLEATTSMSTEPMDPALTFRGALRQAARFGYGTPDGAFYQPVCVTILVSHDNRRLYVESMTSSADAPLAQCWARSFLQQLTRLAEQPDAPMSAHSLVDGAERDRILHRLNRYRTPEVLFRTMTGPFEQQVERTPDAVALLDENGDALTYRELDVRANRLARFLAERGAGTGTRVGICLERSIDLVVAIYAAVKTGAAYVPLDADLPDTRLAYILDDAAPLHVLTDSACRARVPAGSWQVHDVGSEQSSWYDYPSTTPAVHGTSEALLHILYTSGSTGHPKGVAYPTSAALANLLWMQHQYPYGEGDTALFKTSPGFDVSIWEIFWPLYHGGRLTICRPGGHRDAHHLANLVQEHGVQTIYLAPTVMTPFLEQVAADQAQALRWALCGGEPVTPRIRDTFYVTLPHATLVNCYGPTEAGSVTDMVLEPDPGAPVPLGRPAANFRLMLFDENLELVPVGMPGEAYLGGTVGIAHAYWGVPGRTAERFVPDPYGPPGARMYRTGDLCRYRDDGVLEHLGRVDRQVKIRGLRIEPGEVEFVLASHPAVADCAVVAHGDPVRLLAFVVPVDGVAVSELDAAAVAEHAAAVLPDHMRPEHVVPVHRIPATVNGKIDKDALIVSWQAMTGGEREIVPPADELEARLIELYSKVLDTAQVSALDRFVDLGGHSLLAFKLLGECEEILPAEPDVAVLLTGTLREVVQSVRTAAAVQGS